MAKLSIKGAVIGAIVNVVAINALATAFLGYIASGLDLVHMPREQIQGAILDAIHASPRLLAIQILGGVGCSLLGGYIAARVAGHDKLLNGAVSSWLYLTSGIYAMVGGMGAGLSLVQAAELILAPLAGLLGGYLQLKRAAAADAERFGDPPFLE